MDSLLWRNYRHAGRKRRGQWQNGRKEGRIRIGEGSPHTNRPLGCFPVLTRQSSGISKIWPFLNTQGAAWPHSDVARCTSWRGAQPGAHGCCSSLPHRWIRWLAAHHSFAAITSLPVLLTKISTEYLSGETSLLWTEFYFPIRQACAARTVGNVCSNNRK